MAEIENPKGIDALIYSTKEKGEISGVVPDVFNKERGKTAKWVVGIWQNEVTVTFHDGTPFDWTERKSVNREIEGTVLENAVKREYKYTLTDSMGVSIDPRIRVH